jgi:protein gp37
MLASNPNPKISGAYEGTTVNLGEDGVSHLDWTGTVRSLPDRLDQPLRWERPRMIFVNSMSDLFHVGVDFQFLAEVVAVMSVARRHTFQVLTKRPQNMAEWLNDEYFLRLVDEHRARIAPQFGPLTWPLPNVWWGTSIESATYNYRADLLRKVPAVVRWVSFEPLIQPVHRSGYGKPETPRSPLDLTGIHWAVVGGESKQPGRPAPRPMHPAWARYLRDRCQADGVPFFFKQWGEWAPWMTLHDFLDGTDQATYMGNENTGIVHVNGHNTRGRAFGSLSNRLTPFDGDEPGDDWVMQKVGKKTAGRLLDGRTWDQYPEEVFGGDHDHQA